MGRRRAGHLSLPGFCSREIGRAAASWVVALLFALLPEAAPAQNLEAGKSPAQIFSATCSVCHRSPRGLLKTVAPGSLPGFLREHYTTSRDMAQQLSGFLLGNGATDARAPGGLTKQGKELSTAPKPGEPAAAPAGRTRPAEAARPDVDGLAPAEPRPGRAERRPREGTPTDAATPGEARSKLGKRGHHDQPPKETPKDPAPAPTDTKPIPPPVEAPALPPAPAPVPAAPAPAEGPRPDPVPQVTPAPAPVPPPAAAPAPATPGPAEPGPTEPAPAPAAPAPELTVSPPPPPPPPPPPVAPAGPPAPPISQ